SSISQSARTPPPCPPIARMARVIGRSRLTAFIGSCKAEPFRFAAALQAPGDAGAAPRQAAASAGRVGDDVGAVEGRAEDRRIGDLAAIAAADTGIVDRRHRIVAERIVELLHGERRAAGEADAGVVAGADILVDAEARTDDALSV